MYYMSKVKLSEINKLIKLIMERKNDTNLNTDYQIVIIKINFNIMKTKVQFLILIFTISTIMCKVNAQSLQVSPET